jgi:hypothetical protein
VQLANEPVARADFGPRVVRQAPRDKRGRRHVQLAGDPRRPREGRRARPLRPPPPLDEKPREVEELAERPAGNSEFWLSKRELDPSLLCSLTAICVAFLMA